MLPKVGPSGRRRKTEGGLEKGLANLWSMKRIKKTPILVVDKNPNGESRLGWKVGQRKQIEPERKEL
jgi:hypothetical protein